VFEFVKFWWKRKRTDATELNVTGIKPEIVDPSKNKVVKDLGSLPDTVEDSGIIKTEGHISFQNNTKTITRKINRDRLHKSLEDRRHHYYDGEGKLYGED